MEKDLQDAGPSTSRPPARPRNQRRDVDRTPRRPHTPRPADRPVTVQRGDPYDPEKLPGDRRKVNPWRWEWLDRVDKNGDKLSLYVEKLKPRGLYYCRYCDVVRSYITRGLSRIKGHADTSIHRENKRTYNEAHAEEEEAAGEQDGEQQMVPLEERTDRME